MNERKKLFEPGSDFITCLACAHNCRIAPGRQGVCGVRENDNGQLDLLVDGWAVGLSADPIEKKPLYHFLPGEKALSFGTLGCNLACQFCQNWFQSQSPKNETNVADLITAHSQKITPGEIVARAEELGCPAIAYTYNEPTVFVEYAAKTMKKARQAGLKNIWVTNGFLTGECFDFIKDDLDAANIDLKSRRDKFYREICGARLQPVLESIRRFYENDIWLELTTLVIPGENDSAEELTEIANFIADLSVDIPWHISAFHSAYQMKDKPSTPVEKLDQVYRIGREAGLNYIYTGNVADEKHSATLCPNCGKELITRHRMVVQKNRLEDGRCPDCGEQIPGVWQDTVSD